MIYFQERKILFFSELLKQIKPCVENDILKIVTGQSINELTDETLFAANDAFMKRGTTVKLVPSSQKGFYFVFTTKMV